MAKKGALAPVLGIAEHSGWAEFVVVGTQGAAPVVLSRERVKLVDPGIPSNPYHHEGLVLPLPEARALIEQVTRSVTKLTRTAIADVRDRHGIAAVTLRESPYPELPKDVSVVLADYQLTCSADGMMYREGLADAATALGLEVVRYSRKADPLAMTAKALATTPKRIAALVAALGKPLGTPWRKEHQLAAAAALAVLARGGALKV